MKQVYNLDPDPKNFEEIYRLHNQGSYIKSPAIKRTFRNTAFLLVITFLYFFVFIKLSDEYLSSSHFLYKLALVLFLIILQLSSIIILISYIQKALKIRRWKKQVNSFLVELENTSLYKLIIADSTLSIIQNDNKVIEKWSNFERMEIEEEYLWLKNTNGRDVLIPSKSLAPGEFQEICEIIMKKIQN